MAADELFDRFTVHQDAGLAVDDRVDLAARATGH